MYIIPPTFRPLPSTGTYRNGVRSWRSEICRINVVLTAALAIAADILVSLGLSYPRVFQPLSLLESKKGFMVLIRKVEVDTKKPASG